ncbi:hypothetical protein FHW88_003848 [Mucilaginibacter sp. SG538B]|jgi:hypothetical protein|nr:hypothetical protein [Mucilaginibacter sp. SG538B]
MTELVGNNYEYCKAQPSQLMGTNVLITNCRIIS